MKIVAILLFFLSSLLGYLYAEEASNNGKLLAELSNLRLENNLQPETIANPKSVTTLTPAPSPTSPTTSRKHTVPEEIINWRLSAIEKLVPLSDDQKKELRNKFSKRNNDPLTPQRTVDEILGKESAAIYAEAKSRARARVKSEGLEKDVLYISRRLGLSPQDEEHLRESVFIVDAQIEEQKEKDPVASPYAGFSKYIELERLRRDLLQKQLQQFLDAQKYEEYLKLQAESADVEIEMWHGE